MPAIVDYCNLQWAIISAIVVFWPTLLGNMAASSQSYYNDNKKYLPIRVPGWLFMPVWMVLYCCIAVAEILHALALPGCMVGVDNHDQWIIALFVINISLNHLWSVMFFTMQQAWMALIVAFLLLGSAIALCVLYGISALWASMILYCPYILWLIFAVILNIMWVATVPSELKRHKKMHGQEVPLAYRGY